MKTFFTRTLKYAGPFALTLLLALPAWAAKPTINATLEPANIAVGETAQLTVTIAGNSGDEPALPHVDGLEFTPVGQSSSFQSINGVTTSSSSHTYLVRASRAGNYSIPALKIGQGNNTAATPPLALHVTGTAAPQAYRQPSPVLPAPSVPGVADDHAVSANGQETFLRLVMPKHKFYVGELVPVQIKAYLHAGLQVSQVGLPVLNSAAFTLNPLDNKPAQTREQVDGKLFTVLTWTTALTAVKEGEYPLSLEMPVTLTVHEKSRRPRHPFGNSFFDDSFFDDSFFDNFFGNSVEKQITLDSPADAATVEALPAAHRPADFSGAVGQFTVSAEATPDHVTAGDPITLRMTVTGQGNFDRISSGLLPNSADWKSYKPVARFTPADSVGLEGTKTFEQAVVPLQSGPVQIPALNFSYFDPATAKYLTCTTQPISIEVAPAAAAQLTSTPLPAPSTVATARRPEFAPNRVEPGRFTATLRPLFLQPWFLLVNLMIWVGLAVASFSFRRHARRARNPHLLRARQADRVIHEQLAAMDAAVQHAETTAFFEAARRALQQRLGDRWGLPPETITLSEINARLNGAANEIRPIFQMADQLAYSHEALTPGDLAGWKRIVTEQLKHLETL